MRWKEAKTTTATKFPNRPKKMLLMHRENFFSKGEDGADDTTATQQQKKMEAFYTCIYICVCVYIIIKWKSEKRVRYL